MSTKIEITPEVRRFNEAVEAADIALGYLYDGAGVKFLARALRREAWHLTALQLECAAKSMEVSDMK